MFSRKKSKVPVKEGRWTPEEHQRFLQGMMIYGRRWTKVADIVGTRNTVQVRSHAQKYEMKIEKHSGNGQCASEGGHSNDLDANSWTGVVDAPAANGHAQGQGNAMMAFEHEGMHAGHQLQTNAMEENMMQANMSSEEEMAQWAELAVGAPQSQVSDAIHYKAWNELPNAGQMHNQHMGHQPLPHQIDTSYDSYGAMITGTTPVMNSKPASPSSSEDEFMTYLDSNSMEMAMGDDMYSMNMGASDLAPPPMFPEFPSGDSYNGGW